MTLQRAHFEALYAADPDPWDFETSAYEQAKYDATIAALPPGPISTALEVGCSIGVLTERLARPCDRLLAVHWRHPTERYPLLGDEVHQRLADRFGPPAHAAWTADYALDRLEARP